MAHTIRRVAYFHTTVQDRPGEALRFLSALAELGVSLLAFTAIPVGLLQTQLTIFPDDPAKLRDLSGRGGFTVEGPHNAFLVQGDDVPGAIVAVHEALYTAGVNVYASTGVAAPEGGYGYILYVRPESFERAARALDV